MLAHWDICRGTQSDKRLPRGSNLLIEMSFFNIFLKQKKLGAAQVPYFFLPGAAQVPALLLIYIYIYTKQKKLGAAQVPYFFLPGAAQVLALLLIYIYILM